MRKGRSHGFKRGPTSGGSFTLTDVPIFIIFNAYAENCDSIDARGELWPNS